MRSLILKDASSILSGGLFRGGLRQNGCLDGGRCIGPIGPDRRFHNGRHRSNRRSGVSANLRWFFIYWRRLQVSWRWLCSGAVHFLPARWGVHILQRECIQQGLLPDRGRQPRFHTSEHHSEHHYLLKILFFRSGKMVSSPLARAFFWRLLWMCGSPGGSDPARQAFSPDAIYCGE